jgi:hypothetical protein
MEPVYGFSGNDNGRWQPEELNVLSAGGQVEKTFNAGTHFEARTFYFSMVKGPARFVYAVSRTGIEAAYSGFIIRGNFYNDTKAIATKYCEDVNAAIAALVPDEETAAAKYQAAKADWSDKDIAYCKDNPDTSRIRHLFMDGKKPEMKYYLEDPGRISLDELVRYIDDPDREINREALKRAEQDIAKIYVNYIRYNTIMAGLAEIEKDPDRIEHKIKLFRELAEDKKTLMLTLDNGAEIKVDASVFRWNTDGRMSSYYIAAPDRGKLAKGEDLNINQIKKIMYSGKTLYAA